MKSFFTEKGAFKSEWNVEGFDLAGTPNMNTRFNFINTTDVIVKGFDTAGKRIWKTRYIKTNPKDKNIGIQLVSVSDKMLRDPKNTVKKLSQMGFGFIENFV
jgi:hypothetical protein